MRLRSTICIMQQTPSACLDDGRLIYSSSVTCPFYYRETQFQMFLNVESLFLISFNISFFFFFVSPPSPLKISLTKLLYLRSYSGNQSAGCWIAINREPRENRCTNDSRSRSIID